MGAVILRASRMRPRKQLLSAAAAVLAATEWVLPARAQQESAAAAMPRPASTQEPIEVTVQGAPPRSPAWTQSRSFGATRFWLLDPGEQEAEAWYSARIAHNGVRGDDEHLWQLEYMIGVAPRVQLDVYFNLAAGGGESLHIEGAQIETRIALARRYGEIFGNPALYLEWHPQTNGPNRAEVRFLLGGELATPRLRAAINPFVEQNLDAGPDGTFHPDREIGAAGAMSYAVVSDWLSLGAEVKAAADQQDETSYKPVVKAGPALWLALWRDRLRFTSTGLVGLTRQSDRYNPMFILGLRL
jgi:hypothetical protein